MPTVAASKLTDFVAAIMHGAGCHDGEAATIARRLVDSNLVGHDSHGVLRVARYLEWIKDGTLRPNTAPTWCSTAPRSPSSTAIAASAR